MHYYKVWISSQRYHSEKPLTYASESKLSIGTIVAVPMQQRTVAAIVVEKTTKPSFPTKPIQRIVGSTPLPTPLLRLIDWLKDYYPAPFGQIVSTIVPGSLTSRSRSRPAPSTQSDLHRKALPPLTKEQTDALQTIQTHNSSSILLHGDTGTGKTRIYLERARECIDRGQSVILLTPEIGLTPQLALSCQEVFPGQAVVMHSGMTTANRRNAWLDILEAQGPLVIIGPRSALFAPVKNLGLIVIDEFHEPSYKQEQAPHYQATRVGAKLARLHQAQLILGSATPPVSDYYAFRQKHLPIVRMQEQAIKSSRDDSKVELVDIKNRQLFKRSPWLSDTLISSIEQAMHSQQQALVFLNRRGTARLVLCQECGWQTLCPNCDLPLTYHGDTHALYCHTCGHSEKPPTSCPSCSSSDITFRAAGTKSIAAEIERLLPGARVARFDSDTHASMSLEQQYASIKKGSVDVLVGTQMLGKGLDLPRLSVVGIITAETSLFFPDYTAEERTYQLITQALGRVNRGHTAGTAIVQSYYPDSPLLKAATSKNYTSLYEQQLHERKLYKFPPYRHVLKLTCTRASAANAKRASVQLANKLLSSKGSIEVVGPSPAFIEKTHNSYHWQLTVKTTQRSLLTEIINTLPANWSYDIDPMNLL